MTQGEIERRRNNIYPLKAITVPADPTVERGSGRNTVRHYAYLIKSSSDMRCPPNAVKGFLRVYSRLLRVVLVLLLLVRRAGRPFDMSGPYIA